MLCAELFEARLAAGVAAGGAPAPPAATAAASPAGGRFPRRGDRCGRGRCRAPGADRHGPAAGQRHRQACAGQADGRPGRRGRPCGRPGDRQHRRRSGRRRQRRARRRRAVCRGRTDPAGGAVRPAAEPPGRHLARAGLHHPSMRVAAPARSGRAAGRPVTSPSPPRPSRGPASHQPSPPRPSRRPASHGPALPGSQTARAGVAPWFRCYAEREQAPTLPVPAATTGPGGCTRAGASRWIARLESFSGMIRRRRERSPFSAASTTPRQGAPRCSPRGTRSARASSSRSAPGSASAGLWATLHAEHPSVGVTVVRTAMTPDGLAAAQRIAAATPGAYRELTIGQDGTVTEPVMVPMHRLARRRLPAGTRGRRPDQPGLRRRRAGARSGARLLRRDRGRRRPRAPRSRRRRRRRPRAAARRWREGGLRTRRPGRPRGADGGRPADRGSVRPRDRDQSRSRSDDTRGDQPADPGPCRRAGAQAHEPARSDGGGGPRGGPCERDTRRPAAARRHLRLRDRPVRTGRGGRERARDRRHRRLSARSSPPPVPAAARCTSTGPPGQARTWASEPIWPRPWSAPGSPRCRSRRVPGSCSGCSRPRG